jgi:hypothetical protein
MDIKLRAIAVGIVEYATQSIAYNCISPPPALTCFSFRLKRFMFETISIFDQRSDGGMNFL